MVINDPDSYFGRLRSILNYQSLSSSCSSSGIFDLNFDCILAHRLLQAASRFTTYSSHLSFVIAFAVVAVWSPYLGQCWLQMPTQPAKLTAMSHSEILNHTSTGWRGSWRGPACWNLESDRAKRWGGWRFHKFCRATYCSDFAIIDGAALKVKAALCYCQILSSVLKRSKVEPRPIVEAYSNLARQAATRQPQLCCKR